MPAVADPAKELRFTRARQAVGFWLGAAVLAVAGILCLAVAPARAANPQLPAPWWGLAPLVLAGLAARTAVRCSRHAYLIFTPIGLEIFPFFRPASGMQLVPWGQVAAAETDDPPTRLTLHFNPGQTAGIHLSLAPIPKPQRRLVACAIDGLMERRAGGAGDRPPQQQDPCDPNSPEGP